MTRQNHATRDAQIVADYLSGMTLAQVGERCGMTASRVFQIVRDSGANAGQSMAARGGFYSVEGRATKNGRSGRSA